MQHSCSVYGLGVQTNVAIAGLAGLAPPPCIDVRMALGSMPPAIDGAPSGGWWDYYVSPDRDAAGAPHVRVSRRAADDYFRIEYLDGTVIAVDSRGGEVWATWPHEASVEDTATYLLGPTLGFVLRLRAITCLHASAVAIDGRAVAIVGCAGSGKSSTAAAFARLGYPVLTDDVAALVDEGGRFRVQPAYPRVRLWPESVESLFGSRDALPRITPTWEKRFLDLNDGRYRFQREPLPLAALYFLAERSTGADAPRVESLGAREALVSLVANTYANYLLDKSMRAGEFEVLGRLAAGVPLRRATPSADFARIEELCEVIADDCRGI
jgi:hypothetical protein